MYGLMLEGMKLPNVFSFWQGLAGPAPERVTRALSLADMTAYKAFVSSLSAQTKYQRTLGGAVMPSEAQFLQLLSPKPPLEIVLGTLVGDELLAVGRFAPMLEDKTSKNSKRKNSYRTSEFAITVGDAWQGMGLGTSLLKQLKVDAARAGYKDMMAWVFADNLGMISLAQSQGFVIVSDQEADVGVQRLQCSLLATSALLKARTPKTTPAISKPMPNVLSQPGDVALHR
jgi:GNAT superfamily N-acetyltransferase